jgi:hypothetical protein
MSLLIDTKYLKMISSKLERFKDKGNNLYNFRCSACGDSKKKQNKARAYIYRKDNDLFFRCHNCNASTTFSKFLQSIDPTLQRQYAMERFVGGETGHHNYQKPVLPSTKSLDEFKQRLEDPYRKIDLPSIESLSPEHYARIYLEQRKIPQEYFSKLFYADDFRKYVESVNPEKSKELPYNDPRIVIPFFDKYRNYIALQGRALANSLRYITIKTSEASEKIFGLDRLNTKQPVKIVEGPLDSLFLRNCIAVCGSDLATLIKKFPNGVFIFDNEPHKKEIIKNLEQLINGNHSVVIWDKHLKH